MATPRLLSWSVVHGGPVRAGLWSSERLQKPWKRKGWKQGFSQNRVFMGHAGKYSARRAFLYLPNRLPKKSAGFFRQRILLSGKPASKQQQPLPGSSLHHFPPAGIFSPPELASQLPRQFPDVQKTALRRQFNAYMINISSPGKHHVFPLPEAYR